MTVPLHCSEIVADELKSLLIPYGLRVCWVANHAPIPGSYWGESEAGLIGDMLWVRSDTPIHSALHEGSHFLCMDDARRASLHTDAGGEVLEECAVCYLQILLADRLTGVGRERMMQDMDTWGYTFRLGSAKRWFLEDASDARDWLFRQGFVDENGELLAPDRTFPHDSR